MRSRSKTLGQKWPLLLLTPIVLVALLVLVRCCSGRWFNPLLSGLSQVWLFFIVGCCWFSSSNPRYWRSISSIIPDSTPAQWQWHCEIITRKWDSSGQQQRKKLAHFRLNTTAKIIVSAELGTPTWNTCCWLDTWQIPFNSVPTIKIFFIHLFSTELSLLHMVHSVATQIINVNTVWIPALHLSISPQRG